MTEPDSPTTVTGLGEPSGWQMPSGPSRFVPSLTMLGVGLPVGLVIAYGSIRLIAAAWSECGDGSPGGGGYLLFVYLPLVTVLAASGFAACAVMVGHWSKLAAYLAGLAVATLIAVPFVAQEVPAYPAADYGNGHDPRATAACGPQGVPTWWPWWLPS